MKKLITGVILAGAVFLGWACSAPGHLRKAANPVTKPLDDSTQALVKVRKIESKGKTRAIISPADKKQLRIPL